MALLPLLGALVLGQTAPQIQIQARLFTYTGDSMVSVQHGLVTIDGPVSYVEEARTKSVFDGMKVISSPVIRTLAGQAAQIKVEGSVDDYTLRMTPTLVAGEKVTVKTAYTGKHSFNVDLKLRLDRPTLIWNEKGKTGIVMTVSQIK